MYIYIYIYIYIGVRWRGHAEGRAGPRPSGVRERGLAKGGLAIRAKRFSNSYKRGLVKGDLAIRTKGV